MLERDFTADAENCKWAADITYVWTRCGWLYLAVVLDRYSRRLGEQWASHDADRHAMETGESHELQCRGPERRTT